MSRVLFSSRPGYGHLLPLLPLADAARSAGHDVLFATGGELVAELASLGFPSREAGISIAAGFAELLGGAPPPSMQRHEGREVARRVFTEVLPRYTVKDLMPLCDDYAPDVIVYSQWDHGASVVAAMTGVPAFRHLVGRARPLGEDSRLDLMKQYGVDSAEPDNFLDIYPPSMQEPSVLADPKRIELRPVAWRQPAAGVPDWVTGRTRPLVYVSMGSTRHNEAVLRTAIEGLSALDVDVLVASGAIGPEEIRSTGDRVHVVRWVDQAEVLSQADLIVFHGGSGTMLHAIAAGLPQLLLPQVADQFVNAAAATDAGIGLALMPDELTPAAVTAAVSRLADPSYRRAVAVRRDELDAMPGPATVLPRVVR